MYNISHVTDAIMIHVYNLESFIFTDSSTNTIWYKTPSLKEIQKLLKEKSANWDEIGSELDVPLNTRDGLRMDSTLTTGGRLERVLYCWLQREESCTWKSFRKHLLDLDYCDVVQKVDRLLNEQ